MTSTNPYNKSEFIDRVRKLPRYDQLYALGALVTEQYNKLYNGIGSVVVGGLSSAYHSNSQYLTDDIDLVVLDDEIYTQVMQELGFTKGKHLEYASRYWIYEELNIFLEAPGSNLDTVDLTKLIKQTILGHTLYMQGVDDIFIDRLVGYATGLHDDYLSQLDSLYKYNKDTLDWAYIQNACKSNKEHQIFNKIKDRYLNNSKELDYTILSYDDLYMYLDDETISQTHLTNYYSIPLTQTQIYVPKNSGGHVVLTGYFNGDQYIFTTSLETYYTLGKGETVGFTIQDIRQVGGNPLTYTLFRRRLNNYAIEQLSKTTYLTYNQYVQAGIGDDFTSYINQLTIYNQTDTQVAQQLKSKLVKKYKTFRTDAFKRYGTLWVKNYLILVGKKVFVYQIDTDTVLLYDSPTNVAELDIVKNIK